MSQDDTSSVAVAQARADAARARLSQTFGALQRRASPQAIATDLAANLKVRGNDAVQGAIVGARENPVAAGIGVVLTGLFLARGPIFRLFRRKPDRMKR
jgi:hypothetical protein